MMQTWEKPVPVIKIGTTVKLTRLFDGKETRGVVLRFHDYVLRPDRLFIVLCADGMVVGKKREALTVVDYI